MQIYNTERESIIIATISANPKSTVTSTEEEIGIRKDKSEIGIEDKYSEYEDLALIFSYLLSSGKDNLMNRARFIEEYNSMPDAFTQEYFVLFTFLRTCASIPELSERGLYDFTIRQRVTFENTPYINLEAYAVEGTDTYKTFQESTLQFFRTFKKLEVDTSTYLQSSLTYKANFISTYSTLIYENAAQIVNSGMKVGRKFFKGVEDANVYVTMQQTKLKNFMHKTTYRGGILYGYNNSKEKKQPTRKICSLGGIEALRKNNIFLKEKQIFNLVAPSKVGKSRFAINMAYNAILEGANVAIWSLENGFDGAEYMFRARMFYDKYYKAQHKILAGFSDSALADGLLPKDIIELEYAGWVNFCAKSGQLRTIYKEKSHQGTILEPKDRSQGLLANIEEPFTLTTYLDVIDRYTAEFDIDLWIIDYFGLLGEGEKTNTALHERIAEAYKTLKNYMNGHTFAAMIPSQFKQGKYDEFANKSKEELAKQDFQTVAGLSYEIFKTSDINMCLFATPADKDRHEATLYYMPSRTLKPFKPITLDTCLEICYFQSKD